MTRPVLPTRLRILEYLRRHRTATAPELGRALAMTAANVRHHLAILIANDLLEVIGQRQRRRGRPERVYGLSRRVLGDGLDELSSALLAEWLGGLPEAQREAALRLLAVRLQGSFSSSGPIQKRLNETVRFLNERHYQARWEAAAAGPRLILGHCPFAAIIERHPELCLLDAFLLEACLGQPATQIAKLERLGGGLPQCVFEMV